MSIKKTMIILERNLNDIEQPVPISRGQFGMYDMPFGTWLRKHHYQLFKKLFDQWLKEESD